MAQVEGTYICERNENFEDYLKAMGVPFIPRKIICSSTPKLEIKKEGEQWTIKVSTLMRNEIVTFKLGEEYEEHMPGGAIKCITTIDNDKFVTHCTGPNGAKFSKTYEFTDKTCEITYNHEQSGTEGKRYFTRI